MLELRGLSKRYRGVPAVEDVNFTLHPGEILGYLGPNGSGKSTTVKMIAGLIEPSTGQILYGGRDVREDPLIGVLYNRAILSLALAAAIAAVAYLCTYLRHNRSALEAPHIARRPIFQFARWIGGFFREPRARGAAEFVLMTLARGRQQQTVLWLVFGLGLALVCEGLLYAGRWAGVASAARIALPLTLSFFAMVGLRRAFRVASDLPANWLFRFTETPLHRAGQLDSAHAVLVMAGGFTILVPGVFLEDPRALPLQMVLLLAAGEHLLAGWRWLPFTFAQNPARRHLIHSAIVHLLELSVYSFAASTWIAAALSHRAAYGPVLAVFTGVWLLLRYWRLRGWGEAQLEFSESAAAAVEPLGFAIPEGQ